MTASVQIVEKPDWVTWDDIHTLLMKAHRQNMAHGMTMRTATLSGVELEKWLGNGQCYVALADNEKLVGTGSVKIKATRLWFTKEQSAKLMLGAVLPEYQGQGVYRLLLQKRIAYACEHQVGVVIMDTAEHNTGVQAIMLKNGFRYVSYFTTMYSKHNSVMMAKWIGDCPYSKWYCKLRYCQKKMMRKLTSLIERIKCHKNVMMDIYINRSSLKMLKTACNVARSTSEKTGVSWLFHYFDFLWANVFHGCSENHYQNEFFYKLRSFDRSNTVTKGRKNKICQLFNNRAYSHYFVNKVHFNETFKKFIHRDWIYTGNASVDELESFVRSHDRILVKPLNQNKGHGIHLLDKALSYKDIAEKLLHKELLLEEYIDQHPDMDFGGHSVNSIRVISILDKFGTVHILKAGLRCGVGESVVDNFSSGGVFYPLNLEGGFVEGYGKDINQYFYSGIHPGTRIVAIGHTIPHWNKVLEMVRDAALRIPQVRYVGWDVAVLPDDVEMIEGNNGPGCTLLECIGERRGFYKEILSYL